MNVSEKRKLIVDYSHMGRKLTGIERISADIFSQKYTDDIDFVYTANASSLGMIKEQWYCMLKYMRDNPGVDFVFPGFPPSILVSLLYPSQVIPYVHDLFLMERPEDLSVKAKLYMRPSFKYAVRNLKRFFVNSQVTKDKLSQVVGSDSCIKTLRPLARNVFNLEFVKRNPPDAHVFRILMLGTLEPRKNYEYASVLAHRLERESNIKVELHVCGRDGWGGVYEKLKKHKNVICHGYTNDKKIKELASRCHAFMSTSLDEGLGLPVLEIMYSGMPMILSDIPVYREVAAKSGACFLDLNSLDNAVKKLTASYESADFFDAIERSITAIDAWNTLALADKSVFLDWNWSRI